MRGRHRRTAPPRTGGDSRPGGGGVVNSLFASIAAQARSVAGHRPQRRASHRRSVLFFLYLSDVSTLEGGALRAYPCVNVSPLCRCGSHSGDLQIGWLESEEDGSSLPVFLDAWVPPMWMDERRPKRSAMAQWEAVRAAEEGLEAAEDRFYELCQPRSQLYAALANGSPPEPLADWPIDHNNPNFASASFELDVFVERLRARLREPYRRGFGGLMRTHNKHARSR